MNWDYRYTWIRDAAFTVYGFLRIGLTKEAEAFMGWIQKIGDQASGRGKMAIIYPFA